MLKEIAGSSLSATILVPHSRHKMPSEATEIIPATAAGVAPASC